jgi:hypothetical protein
VNLGKALVVWDVLAGLAVFPVRGAAPAATALAGRPVPVEQEAARRGWAHCLVTMGRPLASPIGPAWPAAASGREGSTRSEGRTPTFAGVRPGAAGG